MSNRIPLAIVFAGIVIAFALYSTFEKPSTHSTAALIRPVDTSDHILGNPVAPVMIVEYTDFDCTDCKGLHTILHQLIAHTGTRGAAAWVLREFPDTDLHPNAFSHARAAECIADVAGNRAFWEFADELFARQPVSPSDYGTLAASIGISGNTFATCYASTDTTRAKRISADHENAIALGAQTAPFTLILVQGQEPIVLEGPYTYDAVKGVVDQVLTTLQSNSPSTSPNR